MRKIFAVSGAVVAGAMLFGAGMAFAASQPHMEAALSALQTAKTEIVAADQYNDHGGHAGNATNLINQAISEVELGIQYRNQHGQ